MKLRNKIKLDENGSGMLDPVQRATLEFWLFPDINLFAE